MKTLSHREIIIIVMLFEFRYRCYVLVWKDVSDWRGYDLKELVKFLAWIPSINKYPTTPPKGHAHFQVATFRWGTPAFLSTL